MKHVFAWAEDSEAGLVSELRSVLPSAATLRHPSGLLEVEFPLNLGAPMPHLAFSRQCLPDAILLRADSINTWARLIAQELQEKLPDDRNWRLHVVAHYGERAEHRIGARAWHTLKRSGSAYTPTHADIDPTAGSRRCELIRRRVLELLLKKRRRLVRSLQDSTTPFGLDDSVVQVLLTSPAEGFLSICARPAPSIQRHIISPFPLGQVNVPSDKAAPSRAFAKLVEAEMRLGAAIQRSETCVDLGAAPGSWTYVAASRGAQVTAVDRSPLRGDLMLNSAVRFVRHDAFTFRPSQAVDWLLCDVITEPEQSAELLLDWLRRGECRRFVVTLKIKGGPALDTLAKIQAEMPRYSADWRMQKLCANKKEICVFGIARQ